MPLTPARSLTIKYPWSLREIGSRIKGITLTQVKLGEPLWVDVLEVMRLECYIHKAHLVSTYIIEAYCIMQPLLIPPCTMRNQSKLVSGDATLGLAHRQWNQARDGPGAYRYTAHYMSTFPMFISSLKSYSFRGQFFVYKDEILQQSNTVRIEYQRVPFLSELTLCDLQLRLAL